MHSSWQLLAMVLNHLKCIGPCSVVVKDKSKHTEILFLPSSVCPHFQTERGEEEEMFQGMQIYIFTVILTLNEPDSSGS